MQDGQDYKESQYQDAVSVYNGFLVMTKFTVALVTLIVIGVIAALVS